MRCFKRALSLDPTYGDVLYNLGVLFLQIKDFIKAEYYLRQASILSDNKGKSLINLGVALMELGRFAEAENTLREAICIMPKDADAYTNLGNCLRYQHRPYDALEQYRIASKLNPDDPDIYVNIAVIMRDLLNIQEAIELYRKAILIQPDHAEAHYNLALALLLLGNFKEGWQEYQWRWQTPDFIYLSKVTERMWDGRIGNYKLLLRAEQGFGDTIQFLRYAYLLSERGLNVALQCQQQLVRLLRGQRGISEVMPYSDTPKDYDYQCSLLDLPYLMQDYHSSVPSQIPYIYARDEDLVKWHKIIQEARNINNEGIKIGLVWRGSRSNKRAMHRSCSLQDIKSLFDIQRAFYYHIGKEDCSEEISLFSSYLPLTDLSGLIDDFADTAAIIHHLNLVITVDTAIAHLAGAMGKRVLLMLHYSSDWRWMLNNKFTPWYPTIEIFRQREYGKWDGVIEDISKAIMVL